MLNTNNPILSKKHLHKRSKTLTVLINQDNIIKLQTKYQKSFTNRKLSTIQPNFIQFQKIQNQNNKIKKNITAQIQKIIKRQTQKPKPIKSISQRQKYKSSRTIQQSNKHTHQQYDPIKIQSQTRINFAQNLHQYLTSLKTSNNFNTRPFFPQYNWKQKLIRSKYMGNYGMIFKKSSTSLSNTNNNKINQIIISQQKLQFQQLCNRHRQQLKKLSLNQKHLTLKQKYIESKEKNLIISEKQLEIKQKPLAIKQKFKKSYLRCHTTNSFNQTISYESPQKINVKIKYSLKQQLKNKNLPKTIDIFKKIQILSPNSPKRLMQVQKILPIPKWQFQPWQSNQFQKQQ